MSALTTIGLPVALGIIMFGLGLSLTLGDFARVLKQPTARIGGCCASSCCCP